MGEPGGLPSLGSHSSSYDGDLSLPLGLALGSPIFPSGCEGKLGVALESLQGQGASRAAPGKSGLHARGEGERVLALESREGRTESDMTEAA